MISCKESVQWIELIKKALEESPNMNVWCYENALAQIAEMLEDRSEFIDLSSKVGKTIYLLNRKGPIYANPKFNGTMWELEVIGYHYNSIGKKNGFYLLCGCGVGGTERIHSDRIGKDAFFSIEAAKAKLSEEGLI